MKTRLSDDDIATLKDLYQLNAQIFDASAFEALKRMQPATQASILSVTDVTIGFARAGFGLQIGDLIRALPPPEQNLVVIQIILGSVRKHRGLPARLGIEHLARPLVSKMGLSEFAFGYPAP